MYRLWLLPLKYSKVLFFGAWNCQFFGILQLLTMSSWLTIPHPTPQKTLPSPPVKDTWKEKQQLGRSGGRSEQGLRLWSPTAGSQYMDRIWRKERWLNLFVSLVNGYLYDPFCYEVINLFEGKRRIPTSCRRVFWGSHVVNWKAKQFVQYHCLWYESNTSTVKGRFLSLRLSILTIIRRLENLGKMKAFEDEVLIQYADCFSWSTRKVSINPSSLPRLCRKLAPKNVWRSELPSPWCWRSGEMFLRCMAKLVAWSP